jgi:hypothetical protein
MTTKELLALAEKAELPWERYGVIGRSGLDKVRAAAGTDRVGRTHYKDVPSSEHDAAYIVAACNNLPDLCRRVEDAEAEAERLRNALGVIDGKLHRHADYAADSMICRIDHTNIIERLNDVCGDVAEALSPKGL